MLREILVTWNTMLRNSSEFVISLVRHPTINELGTDRGMNVNDDNLSKQKRVIVLPDSENKCHTCYYKVRRFGRSYVHISFL